MRATAIGLREVCRHRNWGQRLCRQIKRNETTQTQQTVDQSTNHCGVALAHEAWWHHGMLSTTWQTQPSSTFVTTPQRAPRNHARCRHFPMLVARVGPGTMIALLCFEIDHLSGKGNTLRVRRYTTHLCTAGHMLLLPCCTHAPRL